MIRFVLGFVAGVVCSYVLRPKPKPWQSFTTEPSDEVTATFSDETGSYTIKGRMWRDLEQVDSV